MLESGPLVGKHNHKKDTFLADLMLNPEKPPVPILKLDRTTLIHAFRLKEGGVPGVSCVHLSFTNTLTLYLLQSSTQAHSPETTRRGRKRCAVILLPTSIDPCAHYWPPRINHPNLNSLRPTLEKEAPNRPIPAFRTHNARRCSGSYRTRFGDTKTRGAVTAESACE